jgi:hypothetical protein
VNLDRRHLAGSLVMLVGSLSYTVWSFTAGSGGTAGPAAPMALDGTSAPSVTGSAGAAIDPTDLPPVPDVVMDRLPEWTRNPFVTAAGPEPATATAEPLPAPDVEPDIVITTILYSSTRRQVMVNGRILGIGDRVGGGTIVDILPNAIVIDSPVSGRRTIERQRAGSLRLRSGAPDGSRP